MVLDDLMQGVVVAGHHRIQDIIHAFALAMSLGVVNAAVHRHGDGEAQHPTALPAHPHLTPDGLGLAGTDPH